MDIIFANPSVVFHDSSLSERGGQSKEAANHARNTFSELSGYPGTCVQYSIVAPPRRQSLVNYRRFALPRPQCTLNYDRLVLPRPQSL
eukprot:7672106-Pyramimonas_sp.AAC.1